MNIFERDTDFIELDNRKDREVSRVTAESTYNRYYAQLPDWLVKDKSVLDLGSCLASAGHWVLTQGASSYIGLEVQDYYVNTSKELMQKYWPNSAWHIIKQDMEEFLDLAIRENKQWDIVIANGVLYSFFNTFGILEKISSVAKEVVTIDTIRPAAEDTKVGLLVMMPAIPINNSEGTTSYLGLGSNINLKGLDLIMGTNGFIRKEDMILPPKTVNSHDSYHDIIEYPNGAGKGVARYMTRYYRTDARQRTLKDKILAGDKSAVHPNPHRPLLVKNSDVKWSFDSNVAARFQKEAQDHIPDYTRVISLCIRAANKRIKKGEAVIDVGSALGYTLDRFNEAGYFNLYGVESSTDMIANSSFRDRIILSDKFPEGMYKFVMINWTLHFIVEKLEYLQSVYNNMQSGGTLIVTDKTTQSTELKDLYYDFKRTNGVSEEYIKEKEAKLKGYMYTVPASWYAPNLEKIGFTDVEVLNANLGFVTYMCRKP